MTRIVQISDTHLTRAGGVTRSNFDAVAEFVNRTLHPDLIIHTGDVVAVTPDEPADRAAALRAHAALEAPIRFLPGNHDVGEPGSWPWMGLSVTSERVQAHRQTFGPDAFALAAGSWFLIGLNTELLGSGLPEENQQWAWLADAADQAAKRPTVLFVHKPLWLPRRGPSESVLTVPAAARRRILRVLGRTSLRAIGSGHLHRVRRHARGTLTEFWGPSTASVAADVPNAKGDATLGVLCWDLQDDLAVSLHAPEGLEARQAEAIPELVAYLERLPGQAAIT